MELCRILPNKLLYGSQFWPWLHFKPSQQMWLERRKQIQNKIWSNPIKVFPARIDLNCEGMVWCLITIQSSAGGIYEDINQRRNGYDRVILLERSRAILIWWDLSKSCGSYGQAQKVRVWWSETEKWKKLTLSTPFYKVYIISILAIAQLSADSRILYQYDSKNEMPIYSFHLIVF